MTPELEPTVIASLEGSKLMLTTFGILDLSKHRAAIRANSCHLQRRYSQATAQVTTIGRILEAGHATFPQSYTTLNGL